MEKAVLQQLELEGGLEEDANTPSSMKPIQLRSTFYNDNDVAGGRRTR
jgi:hypothetical protein